MSAKKKMDIIIKCIYVAIHRIFQKAIRSLDRYACDNQSSSIVMIITIFRIQYNILRKKKTAKKSRADDLYVLLLCLVRRLYLNLSLIKLCGISFFAFATDYAGNCILCILRNVGMLQDVSVDIGPSKRRQ